CRAPKGVGHVKIPFTSVGFGGLPPGLSFVLTVPDELLHPSPTNVNLPGVHGKCHGQQGESRPVEAARYVLREHFPQSRPHTPGDQGQQERYVQEGGSDPIPGHTVEPGGASHLRWPFSQGCAESLGTVWPRRSALSAADTCRAAAPSSTLSLT